jgi:hypothetical protein
MSPVRKAGCAMRDRQPIPAALRRTEAPTPVRLALSVEDAAKSLSICAKTLKEMPDGPPAIRIGRRVLYRVASLDAWLAAREHANDKTVPADDLSKLH